MKGAYVAAEVITVGRRTGVLSSSSEEQAAKRVFWESITGVSGASAAQIRRNSFSRDVERPRCDASHATSLQGYHRACRPSSHAIRNA